MNESFTIHDRLATLSLFGLGLFVDIRGLYWFTSQKNVINEVISTKRYMKLCLYVYGEYY